MKLNENTAVSAPAALLVPYDPHHVETYHQWMSDPAIQEATASEPLSLEEEHENQKSWRTSHDKLTFIICQPLDPPTSPAHAVAGRDDLPDQLIGDVNLFLHVWAPEDEGGDGAVAARSEGARGEEYTGTEQGGEYVVGEIDIMIASTSHRRRGFGKAAVSVFLAYIQQNMESILAEYDAGRREGRQQQGKTKLKEMVAKINVSNEGSQALFRSLGFRKRGEVNFFGELEMVMDDLGRMGTIGGGTGWEEVEYRRNR